MVTTERRPRTAQKLTSENIDSLRELVFKIRGSQMKREAKEQEVAPREHNELRVISALVDNAEEFGQGILLWLGRKERVGKLDRPMVSTFDGTFVGSSGISARNMVSIIKTVTDNKEKKREYFRALRKGGEIVLHPNERVLVSR